MVLSSLPKMKIAIVKSKLLEALQSVQSIVSKNPVQILLNVLLEAREGQLWLTTTDLDMTVNTHVACEIEGDGATTLPVHTLSSIIKVLDDGRIELESDEGDRCTIKSGSAHFTLNGLPARDFPTFPAPEETYSFVLEEARFREMLSQTYYAVDTEGKRPVLTGLYLCFKENKVTLVGTDTCRLAMAETELDIPQEVERDLILPPKAVKELMRAPQGGDGATVKITANNHQAIFTFPNYTLTTKLIDAAYPNFRKVIPTEVNESLTIERQALLSAIRRVLPILTVTPTSGDPFKSVSLTFCANQLKLLAETAGAGQARETLTIQYAGPEISLLLNPTFISDALANLPDDQLTLHLLDSTRPVTIKNADNFLYIMMPLRRS